MNMNMNIVGLTDGQNGSTAGEVDLTPHCRPFITGKECGFKINLKNIPDNVREIKLSNTVVGGMFPGMDYNPDGDY